MFLGIDGGGTKTAFALLAQSGALLAQHEGGGLYYPQIGLERAADALRQGVRHLLGLAGVEVHQIEFAFIGLPSYGEDSTLQPRLDALPAATLPMGRFRCANDVVCGWAGSLGGDDGISVAAGTGSIAYGEHAGRSTRVGGWGELFGDEGSAYWIARRGLALFSRMSDGRLARGPLYDVVRREMGLLSDLDLCAQVYGTGQGRSDLAGLAPLVAQAAREGDLHAQRVFADAGTHLASLVRTARRLLGVAAERTVRVSYSGGVLHGEPLAMHAFRQALKQEPSGTLLCAPRFTPAMGAAMLAARHAGTPINADAVTARAHAVSMPSPIAQ